MELRNLPRKARPFRWYSALWLLSVVVALMVWAPSRLSFVAALLFFAAWPPVTDRLLQGPRARPGFVLAFQKAECALVGGWLGALPMPPVLAVSAVAALLAANAAQGGARHLLPSTMLTLIGALAGASWIRPQTAVLLPPPVSLGFMALLLVPFTIALGLASFRQALRLHQARETLVDRSLALERLSRRLARYLPEPAQRRIAAAPEHRVSLTRTYLTVTFVDLVGFAELTRTLPAEALAMVLNDYQRALESAVQRAGGTLCQLQGDGVLIYFGDLEDSGVRADHARRCARFCAGIEDLRQQLDDAWRLQGYVVPLALRAGVASGHCTLGDWGAERLDFTVIGAVVNLASRLQQQAAVGTTLVCEATAALLDQVVRLGPVQTLTLKGFGAVRARTLVDLEMGFDMVPSA